MTSFDELIKRAERQKEEMNDQMILAAKLRKVKVSIKLINPHIRVEKLSLGGK